MAVFVAEGEEVASVNMVSTYLLIKRCIRSSLIFSLNYLKFCQKRIGINVNDHHSQFAIFRFFVNLLLFKFLPFGQY